MKRLLALALAFAFCFASPAFAKHHNKHHRHHQVVQVAPPPTDGAPAWVRVARSYLGTNPTGWAHQWCARGANLFLRAAGVPTTRSNAAISFARYGSATAPKLGAIAVMRHHVGFVLADHGARVLLISANHGHRVGIGEYPKARIIGYRWPPSLQGT